MRANASVMAGVFSLCSLGLGCAGHHAPPGGSSDPAFAVVEIRPQPRQTLKD